MRKINKIVNFCGVFLMSSCSLVSENFYWKSYSSTDSSVTLISEKYKNYQFTATIDGYTEIAENLLNTMKNKGSDDEYRAADKAYGVYYNTVIKDYLISRVFYQAGFEDPYLQIYQDMQTITSMAYSYYNECYLAAATSTDTIQKDYYGTSDDEAIQEYLRDGQGLTPQYVLDALNEINTIENEASVLTAKFTSNEITADEYIDQGTDYFLELKENGNIVATYYGYDNYLDYLFDAQYLRNYTPDQVSSSFSTYVNQYITPLIKDYEYSTSYNELTADEKYCYSYLSGAYLGNSSFLPGNLFSDFAVEMAGDYLTTYNHLWKDGYYLFSSNTNSQGTAFVVPSAVNYLGEPITYFSHRYQDVLTVVHEFGHYLNGYLNYSTATPLDIDEVFSQANENLFLNYISHNYTNKKYQRGINFFIETSALNYFRTIARGLVCFDAEYYAYNNEVDKTTLINKWTEIGKSYKDYLGTSSDYYFMYGLISSPGYYISYATSVVAAIEYFCKAEEDFDQAKVSYMNLVKSKDYSMDGYFKSGDIYSPFTEDCYKYIVNNHPLFKK